MTIPALSPSQRDRAHELLAARVAAMLGRKLEENDWNLVYSGAKGIPFRGWSNLNIDVNHEGLGVEHKMLCLRKSETIREYCGTTHMHPAATRSIRLGSLDRSPQKVLADVFAQYAALIDARRKLVREASGDRKTADMRTGWLLWQEDLAEFLYFEEPMVAPDPSAYVAEWSERPARGARKPTKSLWVFEKATGKKRFSITTDAGPKIQPYFDIPPPTDPNLYYFRVQGEVLLDGRVRIWVTETTALAIRAILGSIDGSVLDERMRLLRASERASEPARPYCEPTRAVSILVTTVAYSNLRSAFPGVSDEQMMQAFTQHLLADRPRS